VTRVVTWNVNSLKARRERVLAWFEDVQPDIVCLQETKLADDAFPALDFEALGYASAHYGQGRWNGVAIISRVGLDDVVTNFAPGIEPDPDARIITATCGGIRISSVYVPNGRAIDDPHYAYKLSWLDRLIEHLGRDTSPDREVIVTGDFNIAPTDADVYDIDKLAMSTHVTPAERDRLAALEAWGMTDLFRRHQPGEKLFSWWDYRSGDFHMGRGLRIDLVYGTSSVAERSRWATVDRNARKGPSPSDHAPVVVDLAD
jgi:exodeoxyribonuclease-3